MDFKFLTEISVVPIDSLKPHPLNDKIHTQKKLLTLAKAIKNNDWDVPIVINSITRVITKGHARWIAARDILKLKTVPVILKNYANEDEQLLDLKLDNEVSEIDRTYDPKMTEKILQRIGPQMNRAIDEKFDDIKEKIKKSQTEIAKKIEQGNEVRQQDQQTKKEELENKVNIARQHQEALKVGGQTKDQIKSDVGSVFSSVTEDQIKTENRKFVIIIDVPTQELKDALKEKLKNDILSHFSGKIY